MDSRRRIALLLRAQAGFYIATGLWPLVGMRTFQLATGPKASPWLVKAAGAKIALIGVTLASAEVNDRVTPETVLLSAGSAAVLGTVDVRYAVSGRISKAYLVDATAQALLLAGWVWARRQEG